MTTPTGAVQLLNAQSEPIGLIDFPKAVRMLFRKVVVVVEGEPGRMVGPHPWPRIVRLVRDVVKTWLDKPAAWHRGGVFIRDKHRCAYCGGKGNTIDHILPRSRGGEWSWTNCVAACHTCNSVLKQDMTPEEANMPLLFAFPTVPTRGELAGDRAAA